jgi:hypothetical protein
VQLKDIIASTTLQLDPPSFELLDRASDPDFSA